MPWLSVRRHTGEICAHRWNFFLTEMFQYLWEKVLRAYRSQGRKASMLSLWRHAQRRGLSIAYFLRAGEPFERSERFYTTGIQDSGFDNETRNQEVKRDFLVLESKGKASGGKAHTEITFQLTHELGQAILLRSIASRLCETLRAIQQNSIECTKFPADYGKSLHFQQDSSMILK